jgi:hypothetical protein
MNTKNENKVISTYRVMDNGIRGNKEIEAFAKYKDMSISDIVELLNDCEISYIMNATDEETFVQQLQEREAYISDHDSELDSFEVEAYFRFHNDVDYEIEYDHSHWGEYFGNDVEGIVMYIDGREIFRSFSDDWEFHIESIPNSSGPTM